MRTSELDTGRGQHDLLASVKTLPVGSAKVPRLGVIAAVVRATDEPAAMRAVVKASGPFLAYAAQLEEHGYHSLGAAVTRGVAAAGRNVAALDGRAPAPKGSHPERLNADLVTLLELSYSATFKTAGLTTMEFCPWYVAPVERDELVTRGAVGDTPYLLLHEATLARVARANEVVVRRAAGLLAEARRRGAGPREPEELLGAVLDAAARTAPDALDLPLPEPEDVPSVLKIDYKWGSGGDLVLVDITPAFMGVSFDDVLLDACIAPFAPPAARVASHAAASVFDLFGAARGRAPERIAVVLLDEQMQELWYEVDVAGFVAALRREAAARGVPPGPIPILTLAGLEALAAGETPLPVGPEPWSGTPDLMVQYSFKVGRKLAPAVSAHLATAGVTLVDPRHHALFAVKELAGREVLGSRLPDGVVVPEVRPIGTVAHFPEGDGLVDAVWRAAAGSRRWEVVTVKTEKLPREGAPGDYPTAYIYPVTPVGRRVAERQLPKVIRQLSAAGGGHLRLTLSEVQVEGGFTCGDRLHRDVEIRTYAFPILR